MGYNMLIVMKRLRRVAIGILPWIIGGAAVGGAIVFVARQQHRAAEEYEAAREKRCASSFPLDPEKQDACKHERDSPGNYLPWGYILVAWPEGITTWAIILTFVVVGWQAVLLRRTREDVHEQAGWMKTQAGHMEDQSKILRDSVAVAKQNADTAIAQIEMVKSKERAQLRIEFDPLSLIYDQKREGYPVGFKVFLDGSTRATILNERIVAYLADSPGTKRTAWEPLGIPGIFIPGVSPVECVIFIQDDDEVWGNETDRERVNLVRERKLDVYVTGRILYRDLFGDEWELGIDRIWHQWSSYGNESRGVWTPAGNGEGDYHRKAELRPTKSEIVASFKQRRKPN